MNLDEPKDGWTKLVQRWVITPNISRAIPNINLDIVGISRVII